MPKLLLLARHPESLKNVSQAFSTSQGDEALSDVGVAQAKDITELTLRIADHLRLPRSGILVATSPFTRASGVGESCVSADGVEWLVCNGLRPIDSGGVAGLPEAAAWRSSPDFMKMLELYRAGIASSYGIGGYGEDVRSFESRVASELLFLEATDKEVLLVVAHRSSLTAMLLGLARRSLGYPSDFYGYVQLDLGHVSAIRLEDSGSITWLGVNLTPQVLEDRLKHAQTGGNLMPNEFL